MEPWGTPALTGHSCEDFPSRTAQSCLSPKQEEIRPNIWPEIPQDLHFPKKTSMPGGNTETFSGAAVVQRSAIMTVIKHL